MVVGLIIRLSPGHVIREMLVSLLRAEESKATWRASDVRLEVSNDPAGAGSLVMELMASHSNILSSSICYCRQSS